MVLGNGQVLNPMPPVKLQSQVLEPVSEYKYLGIVLNNQLNWDNHWHHIQRKTSGIPYLLKRMKYLGFKKEILITVYRSHALSHFIYGAPLLSSPGHQVRHEIDAFHRRILGIINIDQLEATTKYNILEMEALIDDTCTKLLKRIIMDPTHPITSSMSFTTSKRGVKKPKPNVAKSSKYANSFVQKYARTLRDGATNLYICNQLYHKSNITRCIPPARLTPASPVLTTTRNKARKDCPTCNKSFIRLDRHKCKAVLQPS